jgi:hypothetical protein
VDQFSCVSALAESIINSAQGQTADRIRAYKVLRNASMFWKYACQLGGLNSRVFACNWAPKRESACVKDLIAFNQPAPSSGDISSAFLWLTSRKRGCPNKQPVF